MNIFILILLSFVNCQYDKPWELHKAKYNLEFTKEENAKRFSIFFENIRKIEEHNSDPTKTFTLKINQFGHLSNEEYKKNLANKMKVEYKPTKSNYRQAPSSDKVDWRDKNVVNPIKSQGSCGSCYAFSTVGALESAYAIKKGKLFNLSVQQIVSCDHSNFGCDGGFPYLAIQYLKKKGIESWEDYPYETSLFNKCHYNHSKVLFKVKGYKNITQNEYALSHAIKTNGPVSIVIDSSPFSFQFYDKGIYQDKYCSTEDMNHAVVLVGYSKDHKEHDYYILRNSWGTNWGIDGYMHIARFKNNMCGVATMAVYPIV